MSSSEQTTLAGPEAIAHPAPHRLPSLTGLRFPAALAVFLYHAALAIPALRLLRDDAAAGVFGAVAAQAGGLGVSFFFVLSGFVLTWSARSGDRPAAFWRRRFAKIVPNYVVAWGLAMVLFAAVYTDAPTAVLNLFMLQVWVPDFSTYFSVDPPSWSLGAEAVFYLAFPALFALVRRIRPERLMLWIGLTVAAIVLVPLLSYLLLPGPTAGTALPGVPGATVLQYWVVYVLPPSRLLDFALGILVARAVAVGRWYDIGVRWSAVLLAVSYVVASLVPHLYGQRAVCVVPVALLIAAVARADVGGRGTPFRGRVMIWLGEVSFAFYLLHFVALATLRRVLGDRMFSVPATAGLLVGTLVVTVGLSWALHTVVERPLTRRWSRPRRARAAVLPTGSWAGLRHTR